MRQISEDSSRDKKGMFYEMRSARSREQKEHMRRLMQAGICIFCPDGLRMKKSPVEYQNRTWAVAKNDYPYSGSRHHLLIIPRRHVNHITDLTKKEWGGLFDALTWTINRYRLKGGGFLVRFGDLMITKGSIAHLHAHVLVGASFNKKTNDQETLYFPVGYKVKKNSHQKGLAGSS